MLINSVFNRYLFLFDSCKSCLSFIKFVPKLLRLFPKPLYLNAFHGIVLLHFQHFIPWKERLELPVMTYPSQIDTLIS